MVKEAFTLLKTRKYMIQFAIFMIIFLGLYFTVDYLNMTYQKMQATYGIYLVIINITLNIIMSFISSLLMMLSTVNVKLKGKDSMGSNMGFVSILFGILTYGCTSCVITFFAAIGISFSVIALPLAGLPYKFISLALILLGLFWVLHELKKGVCKIKM